MKGGSVKRKRVLIGLSLSCVLIAMVLVGASLGRPSARSAKTQTFNFVFRFSDAHSRLDLGSSGSTPGDTETFGGPVLDANEAHRVGFGQGHCVVTLPSRPLAICVVTFAFDHGQITSQGPNYFNRPFNHAITGGTRVFRSAGGEMRVVPISNGEGWRLTLRVVR
jgi:hypothetical protein